MIRTHGQSGKNRTPEYRAWNNMRQRCLNSEHPDFKDYGGRGISISSTYDNFEEFLNDIGPKPGPNYSLDRIDNNWDYEPGNCRWATGTQQQLNKRPFYRQGR